MDHFEIINETVIIKEERYPLLRVTNELAILYCLAYGIVFFVGFIGNSFVIAAVFRHKSMRNITNYFITNLAVADLTIILCCLPMTLMNNIFTEWHFGDFLCKLSIWLNSVSTATSVFTLVAVTADRFAAILLTMRYSTWSKNYVFFIIGPIWLISGSLFIPWYYYATTFVYHSMETSVYPAPYPYENYTIMIHMEATICFEQFPSVMMRRLWFLLVLFVAFIIPLVLITVCYIFIFTAIFRRSKRQMACDHGAVEREHRLRLRITVMMLIVIIVFTFSWSPLYSLYIYFNFGNYMEGGDDYTQYLRPVFQWLGIANSCVNPILYACFSLKYREAFRKLCLLPFRRKYLIVRQATRTLYSSTYSASAGSLRRKWTVKKSASKRHVTSRPPIPKDDPSSGATPCMPMRSCIPQDESSGISDREDNRIIPNAIVGGRINLLPGIQFDQLPSPTRPRKKTSTVRFRSTNVSNEVSPVEQSKLLKSSNHNDGASKTSTSTPPVRSPSAVSTPSVGPGILRNHSDSNGIAKTSNIKSGPIISGKVFSTSSPCRRTGSLSTLSEDAIGLRSVSSYDNVSRTDTLTVSEPSPLKIIGWMEKSSTTNNPQKQRPDSLMSTPKRRAFMTSRSVGVSQQGDVNSTPARTVLLTAAKNEAPMIDECKEHWIQLDGQRRTLDGADKIISSV